MSEAKKKILARRAQFVAAAIAGFTVQACGKDDGPRPCLSPPAQYPSDAQPPTAPTPCLAVPVTAPVPADAAPQDASKPDAK